MELATSLNVIMSLDKDKMRDAPMDAIKRIAASGFKVFDFNLCDMVYEGSPFMAEGWQAWMKDIRNAADFCESVFTQAHGPFFFTPEQANDEAWLLNLFARSAEAVSILGVKWMVVHPVTYFDGETRENRERNHGFFSKLIPTLEKTGVGIAIENMSDRHAHLKNNSRMYCSTAEELTDLVDSFGHRLVGVCWDTGHAHMQNLNQEESLKKIGKRLKAMHVQDNNGLLDQHLIPMYGTINWRALVKTLKTIDYEGDFTYEAHNFFRQLPDELKDSAVRFSFNIGNYLIDQYY